MKTRLSYIFITLVIAITSCTTTDENYGYYKRCKGILMDSLFLKDSLFISFKVDKKDLHDVDFIPITMYKLADRAKYYKSEESFLPFLLLEPNRIDGYVLFKGEPIGFIQGYFDNDRWWCYGYYRFSGNEPMAAFYNTIPKDKIDDLYYVIAIGGIWYEDNGSSIVYDFYSNSYKKGIDYIKNTVGKDGLIDCIGKQNLIP